MNQNKLTRIISLASMVVGLLFIIFGIIVMDSYNGYWGDTYTYSDKATVCAGNNVNNLGEMLQQILSPLFPQYPRWMFLQNLSRKFPPNNEFPPSKALKSMPERYFK